MGISWFSGGKKGSIFRKRGRVEIFVACQSKIFIALISTVKKEAMTHHDLENSNYGPAGEFFDARTLTDSLRSDILHKSVQKPPPCQEYSSQTR